MERRCPESRWSVTYVRGELEVYHAPVPFREVMRVPASTGCDPSVSCLGCDRYEEDEADGTDSTVYSTAVALAIMGCFQVRGSPFFSFFPKSRGNQASCRQTNPIDVCLS